MAVSRSELQVTWATAANSSSISSGSNENSEAFTFSATTFDAIVQLKADNDGTPASGDTVDFYVLYTSGDPDGASTDEYDTDSHGTWLATLDTNTEDPAGTHVEISVAKGGKIRAVNNSGGRAITVSATITEILAS